jgi:4-hydroxy-tetrahydrodipicolinate reductase
MGTAVRNAVENAPDFTLAEELIDDGTFGHLLLLDQGDDLTRIQSAKSGGNTDVVVEFSVPDASFENVQRLVRAGNNVVVGTTGWTPEKLAELEQELDEIEAQGKTKPNVLIAANFSISAVLLERFAKIAAPYFESAEVVEMHHPDKLDAPSGTAISTAKAISQARKNAGLPDSPPDATSADEFHARGAKIDGISVHAIRNRGLTAHEAVLFGNPGEQFELRQDSFTRESFMPGVLAACRYVSENPGEGLIRGLDQVL